MSGMCVAALHLIVRGLVLVSALTSLQSTFLFAYYPFETESRGIPPKAAASRVVCLPGAILC